ncbi:hypothetical protein CONCODRAFT_79988 [Conidiobolus coronatus NRRL 28638]|uniref:Uncharacterized protein n=1 Tax=Conidiobolus coronatus (strain ATCC 28846 / CBS 209.66 / NRRL 28638) TaxID=796925 RepID=A0A137NYJ0_CONC2|nr:hypothetical protein CONCODRAFT_79988 [Conidiobolus coronatus NRRL 28638]|eukprot:KXN67817.1 hypothetical protein CONCODRAFT_79988 [Conidiobolus coronatus NRRL 28638]
MDLRISELERIVQTDVPIEQLKLTLSRLNKRVRTSCPHELTEDELSDFTPLNYCQFNKMTTWLSEYTDRWLQSISFEKDQLLSLDEGSSSILFLRKMVPHTTFQFWSELHQTQQYFYTHFTTELPSIQIPKKEKQFKGALLYAIYETQPNRFYETHRHLITLLRMYILFLTSNDTKSNQIDFWIPLNENEGEMLSEFISRAIFTCRFSAIIGGYGQIARELDSLILSMVQFIEDLHIPIQVNPPPIKCKARVHDHQCECRYESLINFIFQANVVASNYPLKCKPIEDFYTDPKVLKKLRSELVGEFHHKEYIPLTNSYLLANYQSGKCTPEELGLIYLQLTQYSLMIMYHWPTLFNFPLPAHHFSSAEQLILQTQASHIHNFCLKWYNTRPETVSQDVLFPPIPPHVIFSAIVVYLNMYSISQTTRAQADHGHIYLEKANQLEKVLDCMNEMYHSGSEFKTMLQDIKSNFLEYEDLKVESDAIIETTTPILVPFSRLLF